MQAHHAALAFAEYCDIAHSLRQLHGTVDRIARDGPTVYFTLRGGREIFAVDAGTRPALLLVRAGDAVRFRAPAGGSGVPPQAEGFEDSELPP